MSKYMVTGGCGFIGSHLLTRLLKNESNQVLNVDSLTYAAQAQNVIKCSQNTRYEFVKADIRDGDTIARLLKNFKPDVLINLAAETHVDTSIASPENFIQSNILGVYTLLEACRAYLTGARLDAGRTAPSFRFYQVSTDEVFGDADTALASKDENAAYQPSSPYSASKAAADHLVNAWHRTYAFPAIISACTNNYGPGQHHEKLIPKVIRCALNAQPIPLYGDGKQQRDWLYVEDHVAAIALLANKSEVGESWNIASGTLVENKVLIKKICTLLDEFLPQGLKGLHSYYDLVQPVEDRPGHDKAYKISAEKIQQTYAWAPKYDLDQGLRAVVITELSARGLLGGEG